MENICCFCSFTFPQYPHPPPPPSLPHTHTWITLYTHHNPSERAIADSYLSSFSFAPSLQPVGDSGGQTEPPLTEGAPVPETAGPTAAAPVTENGTPLENVDDSQLGIYDFDFGLDNKPIVFI